MTRPSTPTLRPSLRAARWAFAPALALAACNSHTVQTPVPEAVKETAKYVDLNPVRDLDILFVIDDSNSMIEEQKNLRDNFPLFMEELRKIPGGLPNVHIGVASTDMGAGKNDRACNPGGKAGALLANPGCGLDANARWIVASDNETKKNYTGTLASVFSCMANLGVTGCGYEHQLQAAKFALGLSNNDKHPNFGFLRPNAYLAVVFLTDEDDCSADFDSTLFNEDRPGQMESLRCAVEGHVCAGKSPEARDGYSVNYSECKTRETPGKLLAISEFVSAIKGLKGEQADRKIIVSGIIGKPDDEATAKYQMIRRTEPENDNKLDIAPACLREGTGKAYAGLRMKTFIESFANNSTHPICQENLREAMTQIGKRLAAVLQTTCLDGEPVDTDENKANVQADCQVKESVPDAQGRITSTLLPECTNGGPRPCWKLTPQPGNASCAWKVDTERTEAMAPPGATQAIKCWTK